MIAAIVFLPLLGFLVAAAAGLTSYRLVPDGEAQDAHGPNGHGQTGHTPSSHQDHTDHEPGRTPETHGHDDHAPAPSPHSTQVVAVAEWATTALLFTACVLSWFVFAQVGLSEHGEPIRVDLGDWMSAGSLQVGWALRVDTLTAVMLVVVTTVSSLVHLYSVGYMAEDPFRPRFFAYLSLFTFAMLMLVTSDNLVQLFFGWEGVGLASYLLIGFWYEKPSANAAAMKAFIVNRVGDFGFALGIFMVFAMTGSVAFDTIFAAAPGLAEARTTVLGFNVHAMTAACLLLFMGAMGKSAQFLLHTWLPDAMEGPTPVSALIHAATMVTAGVFMVARLSPLFELAPAALAVVTVVGGTTAFFAATVGLVQNDIKRVIAYSTCSQLGYMFVAMGVGAYSAGMFHLFTHAFFKALLFLGAGSVIHAMHHEQDMRKMGGLARKIPFTAAMMAVGTLALTGFPLFAGFYSKDAIIASSYVAGQHGSVAGTWAFLCVIAAAGMTSFYSWRLFFLTFMGRSRADADTLEHAHESPRSMTAPLALLAIGAVLAGLPFEGVFIGHGGEHFWKGALFSHDRFHVLEEIETVPGVIEHAPFAMMLLGFALAVYFYILRPDIPARVVAQNGALYRFLLNKWYFDELYDAVFVRPAKRLGHFLWKRGDGWVIDGFGPDGVSAGVIAVMNRVVRLQTGFLYHYAFAMLLGVAGLFTFFMFGARS